MKIYSERVYLNEVFTCATIEFENGKIISIKSGKDVDIDVDYGKLRLFPGFIDIHAHGNSGVDANSLTEEDLRKWKKVLINEGVTSFLVTTSTTTEEELLNSFNVTSKLMKQKCDGAHVLGIHVEGPHISFNKRGAHNPYLIREPSVEEFIKWQAIADNQIKLICIAPEMDKDHAMIKYCSSHGVKVALGHTTSSYEEACLAIESGACDFTHTFNAMPNLLHRAPGTVGAALSIDSVYAECIVDGIHVHPAVCKLVTRAKGKDKVVFITDSSKFKGLEAGKYYQENRSDQACYVLEDGRVELSDGTLAGGSCKVNEMLYRAIELMGIDEVTAYNAFTINPATMMGFSEKGLIEVGRDADFTVLNDDYSVHSVYCFGNKQN